VYGGEAVREREHARDNEREREREGKINRERKRETAHRIHYSL